MIKISAVIPVRNESIDLLTLTISNLTEGISPDDLEVVVVNDGSIYPDGTHQSLEKDLSFLKEGRNLKFIDNKEQYGVGYCFDRGTELALGDTIVLMGSDTLPEARKWFVDVLSAVKDEEMGCCCSVGLNNGNFDINKEGCVSRYGASISWTMTHEDLPKTSPLRNDPNYREIIGCRWASKKSDEPYEIEAIYGAWYFCKKEFYQKIGGFDTKPNNHFHGHSFWGHLESLLSLKVRVYNGRCMMYPNIRVGHIFGRIDQNNVNEHRAVREDFHYWNRLWIAHTLLSDELRDKCLNHLLPCLCLSQAQVWIKHHWKGVKEVRERNILNGKLISE
jgi:glycosyltransferase involved in cell wall biosynthesis